MAKYREGKGHPGKRGGPMLGSGQSNAEGSGTNLRDKKNENGDERSKSSTKKVAKKRAN